MCYPWELLNAGLEKNNPISIREFGLEITPLKQENLYLCLNVLP
jgi:hypothetical protein